MNGHGWQVHRAGDHLGRFDRLFISRLVGAGNYEVIVGFGEDGAAIVKEERAELAYVGDWNGLLVPFGVLEAITEVVKPGPSRSEVARLEDALAVERGRIDSFLARVSELRT